MNINHEKAKEYFFKGIEHFQNEEFNEAKESFLNSLKLAPDRLSVIENLIATYVKTEDLNGTTKLINDCKHLESHKEIQFGIAYLEHLKKNLKLSNKICEKLLTIKDNNEEKILTLLGANYYLQKRFLEAFKIYKKLLNKKKDFFAYYNLGLILFGSGKIKKSYSYLKKSIELKKNNFNALWNMSLCSLTLSKLEEGFKMYEYRWKTKDSPEKKFKEIPELTNLDNLQDKKILIWDEQGLGDTINFSRFALKLLNYTKKIDFTVNKKLKELLFYLDKNIKILSEGEITTSNYDYQISVLSIPALLCISSLKELEAFKIDISLNNKNSFKDEIKNTQFNLGMCWSGNPDFFYDEFRSLPLSSFKEILSLKNTNFYKLSKGLNLKDKITYHSNNFLDLGEKNFYELSHVLPKLDFIFSTDTSIIHLCGALGIKATLLLNYNADWRWFFDDKKTIWYPSIEILRCKRINEWKPVLEKLKIKIMDAQKIKLNKS